MKVDFRSKDNVQEFITWSANEIKRLEATIESLQWISVETELPERGIRVLAYSIKADNSLAYRLIDGAFVYQLCEITHWMPIPSPPEVKT